MYKIMICDDDEKDLQATLVLLQRYQEQYQEMLMDVQTCHSVKELTEAIQASHHFDIYLLDIMMETVDGIEVGKMIRKQSLESAIVYITASQEYALRAFGVYASGYLVKPVSWEQFSTCMNQVFRQIRPEPRRKFLIKVGS